MNDKHFKIYAITRFIDGKTPLFRYGLAVVVTVIATIITLLAPAIARQAVFFFFFFAILQVAFWLGRNPGFLTLILSFTAINTLFLLSEWVLNPQDALILNVCFLTLAIVFIIMTNYLRGLTSALWESQQDLNHAQAIGKIGNWRMNVQRNELLWSDQNHRIFGIPKGMPMTYETFLSTVHPDDLGYVDQKWQAALRGEPYNIEHRIIVSGNVKWLRERAELEFDKNGELQGGFGITQDITDLKTNELALQETKQKYAGIVESAMDAVIAIDANQAILIFNTAAEKIFGWQADEVLGKPVELLIPERFRHAHSSKVNIFANAEITSLKVSELGILSGLRKSGEEFPIETSISKTEIGGEKIFTAILRDITERKLAKDQLQEQLKLQDQLTKVAATVPGLICSFQLRQDGTTGMPYASPMFEDIYGLKTDEVVHDFSPVFDRIHPDDIAQVNRTISESARTMQPWRDCFRYLHPQKGVIWLEGHSMPHKESDGSILWHGYIQDITERKQAEATLQERIDRYELVLDGAQDAIWDWDIESNRVHYSSRWKELHGFAEDEASDSPEVWSSGIHPDDYGLAMGAVQAHLQGETSVFYEEYRIRTKSGSWKWILNRGLAQRDKQGRVIRMAGSENDITDRKLSEMALRAQENQLRLIMDAAPALISYINTDFQYLRVNKTYENWFCLHREHILGQTVRQIVGKKAWAIIGPFLERARSGERVHFDSQIPYGTSKPRWVRCSYIPDTDAMGVVRGIVIYVVDFDERKQAEDEIKSLNRSLQRRIEEMQVIFNTAPIGIMIAHDTEGHHFQGNPTIEKLLGLPSGSEISKCRPSAAPYQVMQDNRHLPDEELPMQRAICGETVINQSLDILRPDGQMVTLLSNAAPLFNEEGIPRGAIGVLLDITEIKKAQQSLRKNEEQYRLETERHLHQLQTHQIELELQNQQLKETTAALETSRLHYLELYDFAPVAYLSISPDGLIDEINLTGTHLLGTERKKLILKRFAQFISPEYSDQWHRYFIQAKQHVNQKPIELQLHRKDGTPFFALVDSQQWNAGNNLKQLRIVLTDITEQKRIERELLVSESRLALGLQVAELALAEIDYKTGLVKLTTEAARLFGLGDMPMTLPRETIHATFYDGDRGEIMRRISQALDPKGKGFFGMDHRVVWPYGDVRWLRVYKQVFFTGDSVSRQASHATMAIHDITTEKRATENLLASETFVRNVLDSLPEHVVVLDNNGVISAVNEPWVRFANENDAMSSEVSVGANYLEVCQRSSADGDSYGQMALTGLEALLAGDKDEFLMEYPCSTLNRNLWYLMYAKRVNQSPIAVIITHLDITQRKLTESALRESELRLGLIIKEVKAGYWDRDLVSDKTYFSPEWKRQIGFDDNELSNQWEEWENRLHPDDRDKVLTETDSFIAEHQPIFDVQYRLRHKDGSYLWIHSQAALLRDSTSGPNRMLGMNLDITDYVKNQEMDERRDEMEKSFRLYIASQTAAAIAHELNQPLTAISYYAFVVQDMLNAGNPNPQRLTQIMEKCVVQAQRAGETIKQLMGFLHKGETTSEPLDINKTVNYVLDFVKLNGDSNGFKVDLNLDADLPMVMANALQIQKVLINLINNGFESMKESGRKVGAITVTTRRSLNGLSMAQVTVSDCGHGVADKAALNKLFQPFYTSKAKGLGMGLAISRALIEALGGKMWAEPNPDTGISVHFTLPLTL